MSDELSLLEIVALSSKDNASLTEPSDNLTINLIALSSTFFFLLLLYFLNKQIVLQT